jgi:hypothetical protein
MLGGLLLARRSAALAVGQSRRVAAMASSATDSKTVAQALQDVTSRMSEAVAKTPGRAMVGENFHASNNRSYSRG